MHSLIGVSDTCWRIFVCLLQTRVVTVRVGVGVCMYRWMYVMCYCKRATFLWCSNKTLCQNCWLDEIKRSLKTKQVSESSKKRFYIEP